jgi:cytochrome c oxidase assembly factor CtaG
MVIVSGEFVEHDEYALAWLNKQIVIHLVNSLFVLVQCSVTIRARLVTHYLLSLSAIRVQQQVGPGLALSAGGTPTPARQNLQSPEISHSAAGGHGSPSTK